MGTVEHYRHIIESILTELARIPYAHGDIELQTVFDREKNHYVLMLVGRDGIRRVHGCLVHVDIRGEKLWIQRDGTERDVARALLEAGVPKDHIVLAFRSPEMRKSTDFAIA
jgi:XisI protein